MALAGLTEDAMEKTATLDRRIVKELEASLRERRGRLRESVRARMAEGRMGEPRRSPEDATNAVESFSKELELTMLDRENVEAAQIDAALERLARDEYGICRTCDAFIGLGRLKALPFALRCTACQADEEARQRRVEADRRLRSIRPDVRPTGGRMRPEPSWSGTTG